MPAGGDWRDALNPHALEILAEARVDPGLAAAAPGTRLQFVRLSYFCADRESKPDVLVFNRTTGLKNNWAKIEAKG